MTAQRPRPRTRLAIDPDNAYARLGAPPLATTDEIKKLLSDKRGKAMAARRAGGQQAFGAHEQDIIELQAIEKQIGTPAARAAYDREHPQNALLTVQSAPRDKAFEPAGVAALVTAWLVDELGPDAMLLHPDAYWLWLPGGLDAELAAQLAPFAAAAAAPADRRAAALDVHDLASPPATET
ncbi:MAG TPA: hypothetical protein VF469_01995 [Kofleriaceae bacterium]